MYSIELRTVSPGNIILYLMRYISLLGEYFGIFLCTHRPPSTNPSFIQWSLRSGISCIVAQLAYPYEVTYQILVPRNEVERMVEFSVKFARLRPPISFLERNSGRWVHTIHIYGRG
jgi:hypothetical protein